MKKARRGSLGCQQQRNWGAVPALTPRGRRGSSHLVTAELGGGSAFGVSELLSFFPLGLNFL